MINRSILGIWATTLRPQKEVKVEKGCKNTKKQNQIYEDKERYISHWHQQLINTLDKLPSLGH